MSCTRLGLDVGHCDTMLCMRLPDGTVRCLKLDCAGSTKINTALAFISLTQDEAEYKENTHCTLIGDALSSYETLAHLTEYTLEDLKKQEQEFDLLLRELCMHQKNRLWGDDEVFFVPVPCAPDALAPDVRALLLARAQEAAGEKMQVSLYQAQFSPICQYFKMSPAYWDQPCVQAYTYHQLMEAFICQLLCSARMYNNLPDGEDCHYMIGCPADEDWLSDQSRAVWAGLVTQAHEGCTADAYSEPMAAFISALAMRQQKEPPPSLCEGYLVDDHGSLTADYCMIVARRDGNNVLEYCRVKGASDRIGGHLIESEMLLRVLSRANVKSSQLRAGDRAFALRTLRRWKEEYCRGEIPAAADERALAVRLKDGSCRYIPCSVGDLVWAAVHQTPVAAEKTWRQWVVEYKQSIWKQLKNSALPCAHVVLTGGVNNMPAARDMAREAYEDADIHMEEDASLSVADGLCRALSSEEEADFRTSFAIELPVSPYEYYDENLVIPLHRDIARALEEPLAEIIGQSVKALGKNGRKYTFDAFRKTVAAVCEKKPQLQQCMRPALNGHALGLFEFLGRQAIGRLPESFPGSLPGLSPANTFDDDLNALCTVSSIVQMTVQRIVDSFFFTAFAVGPARHAKLAAYGEPGRLYDVLVEALNRLDYVHSVNNALGPLFKNYILDRITYSRFDVDQ